MINFTSQNIVLLGKNGQLARAFQHTLRGCNVTVFGKEKLTPSEISKTCKEIESIKPGIIINTAAYTNVDGAEIDRETCYFANAIFPQLIAELSKNIHALFIHFSTDYVFSGTGENLWTETDIPSPLNYYGQTKWDGEKRVASVNGRYLIFRTSWVYAVHGKNFVKTILEKSKTNKELRIVCDQWGSPTSAESIARAATLAMKQEKNGIYHFVDGGVTNWFDFAQYVFEKAVDLKIINSVPVIHAIKTANLQSAAKRPLNSRLSTVKFQIDFDYTIPHWKTSLSFVLSQLTAIR